MEVPLLIALQKAPALLICCKSAGVLHQLRAVSRASRKLATAMITSFTLLSGNAAQQADVQRMLTNCKLTKVQLSTLDLGTAEYGDPCVTSDGGASLFCVLGFFVRCALAAPAVTGPYLMQECRMKPRLYVVYMRRSNQKPLLQPSEHRFTISQSLTDTECLNTGVHVQVCACMQSDDGKSVFHSLPQEGTELHENRFATTMIKSGQT